MTRWPAAASSWVNPARSPTARQTMLLRAAAARDVPDGLHLPAPHGVDAIVEVDGRVAVRREEFDELAQGREPPYLRDHETSVLVPCPRIRHARALDGLGHEGLVGGEGLEPAVHHGHLPRRHAEH